jgi:hypothetical protein
VVVEEVVLAEVEAAAAEVAVAAAEVEGAGNHQQPFKSATTQ